MWKIEPRRVGSPPFHIRRSEINILRNFSIMSLGNFSRETFVSHPTLPFSCSCVCLFALLLAYWKFNDFGCFHGNCSVGGCVLLSLFMKQFADVRCINGWLHGNVLFDFSCGLQPWALEKTELFSLEWIHCCIRLALLFVNITDGKKGFPSANKDEKKCDFDGILFEPNIREENVNEKPLFRFRFLYFVTIQL